MVMHHGAWTQCRAARPCVHACVLVLKLVDGCFASGCHMLWMCSEATETGKSSLEIDPHIASVYTKALEAPESRFHAIVKWLKVRPWEHTSMQYPRMGLFVRVTLEEVTSADPE